MVIWRGDHCTGGMAGKISSTPIWRCVYCQATLGGGLRWKELLLCRLSDLNWLVPGPDLKSTGAGMKTAQAIPTSCWAYSST